jgi:hypothetical protein
VAPAGAYTGQFVYFGKKAEVAVGNVLPVGQCAESTFESRHRVGKERLTINGSAGGDLQTRRRRGKSRVKFRYVATYIQPEANNEPGRVTPSIARLGQYAAHLAETARHAPLNVSHHQIIRPLQANGADLHSRGIFNGVSDRK